MDTKLIPAAAVAAVIFLLPLQGRAQTFITYTDNAANATSANGYTLGDGTQGSVPGFGNWNSTSVGSAGRFVFTAAPSEGGIDASRIDSSGVSFGLYANNNNGNTFSSETITRAFNTPLEGALPGLQTAGDSFSLDFVGGNNDGGNVSVSLLSGTTRVGVFNYNGSNGNFEFNGAATGATFATGSLHLTYTLNSASDYSFTSSGAASVNETGTFSSPITGFEVQQMNAGMEDGSGSHNAYFNNLTVTAAPEPSQIAALALMGLGIGGLLLRRRQMKTD